MSSAGRGGVLGVDLWPQEQLARRRVPLHGVVTFLTALLLVISPLAFLTHALATPIRAIVGSADVAHAHNGAILRNGQAWTPAVAQEVAKPSPQGWSPARERAYDDVANLESASARLDCYGLAPKHDRTSGRCFHARVPLQPPYQGSWCTGPRRAQLSLLL